MNIFTLTGSILVDSRDAENSISKTGKEAEGMGAKLTKGIGTAAKFGAAIAAAGVAAGGAMVAAAKQTATAMDEVDKASQRMKVSAESYQELAHAAELSGVQMGTLERAAKKLEGTDLNFDDAMAQIYELGTAEERAAKASELFGEKVAYQMTPMLNASAEEMAGMRQEAHDLGMVMSDEAVKNGAALNDMFTKVDGMLNGLKNNLMTQFMPYIMEILQWVQDNLPKIMETVGSVMDAVWPLIKTVLDLVMAALPPLMDAIRAFLDWIMPYLKPILNAITGVVEGVIKLIHGDVSGFVDSIKNFFTTLADSMLGIGKDIFNKLWEGLKSVWDSICNWVTEKVDWIKDKLTFWEDSNRQMNPDTVGQRGSQGTSKKGGKHAAGLAYVPYDGYQAELHKGESVLNAQNAAALMSALQSSMASSQQSNAPIELTLNIDGRQFAKATYGAMEDEAKRRGTRMVTI